MNRLFERSTKRKKTWKTPKKHRDKLHIVGYYKGHMKDVTSFMNIVSRKPVKDNQVDKKLAFSMNHPAPLEPHEVQAAKDAGLEVKGQYVVSKL